MGTLGTDLGRYELLIELGRGGMAELFLGRLRGAGGFSKLVAIKRILPHLAQDRQFTQMFLDEGRIASRLSHPNVCQVFELGDTGGVFYLAMEYLDGVSWECLCAAAPRDPRLIAGVLAQAAEGLHYAHTLRDHDGRAMPVIHRDVSPQNLFVTVDGVCKVLDFGVSKMMTVDGPRTRTGVIKGKLPYMSPEQIRAEPLDGRADVFALGVCAWEAFAAARLFHRDSDFLIWKAITEQDAPPLRARWPECPPALEAVVQRSLARDPSARYATAQQFADELRGAVGFAAPAEIAACVRARCSDRLADRAKRVATVIGQRGEPAPTPSVVTDAGATLDLKEQSGPRLRDQSIVVERAPAPARRRRWPLVVAIGVIAVLAIALVGVLATRRSATVVAAADAPTIDATESRTTLTGSMEDLRGNLEGLRERLAPLRELQKLDPHATGRYRVDSKPEAKVFANGEDLGTTPIDVELAPGTYEIRAVLEDGREQKLSVEIRAGKKTDSKRLMWW